MEGEEGGGIRLSKRFCDKDGEVDYKTKAGTAWSHSYLNQKPWHPLSYPNQRRKWIAEQTHAHKQRRADEVAREYAQEQEFFRQTAVISKKEKEKVELMQAVSFMYVRPPGYNAESAKAAEIADERKKEEPSHPNVNGASSSMPPETSLGKDLLSGEKKKPRPKDVFGRPLPTEEEFEILKNAPRMETGVTGRVKPFGVEVRNVKCLRCGNYGHQSGDRECPLKDVIMPNEESRLKRDDPLNAIIAHTDPNEPLKWELKQKPGLSPPRGGFKPDDPNQQIVSEDIFDEYGGFLNAGDIPDLLTTFSKKPKIKSKKNKHKKQQSDHSENETSSNDGDRRSKKKRLKVRKKKQNHSRSSSSDTGNFTKDQVKSRNKHSYSSEDSDSGGYDPRRKTRGKQSYSPKGSDYPGHSRSKHSRQRHSVSSEDSGPDGYHGSHKRRNKHSYTSVNSDGDSDDQTRKNRRKHSYSTMATDRPGHERSKHSRNDHSYSFDDSDHQRRRPSIRSEHSSRTYGDLQKHHRSYGPDHHHRHGRHKSRDEHSYLSESSDGGTDDENRRDDQKYSYPRKGSAHSERDRNKHSRKKRSYSSEDSGSGRYHRSHKGRNEP